MSIISVLRSVKETLFGMFYVMQDGVEKPSPAEMRKLLVLLLIDSGQVLRLALSTSYGWSKQTYAVGKHVDMVYDLSLLVSFVVPRYMFFVAGFILVGFAIGNALYCARLFKGGEVNKIGPLKALRLMVVVVVTTLFSTMLDWLLMPVECLVSDELSLSRFIHGPGSKCTPWAFPEIMLTLPTLVLIVLFVMFSLTFSLFCLGTNPLSCRCSVQFTGRVEALWNFVKVLQLVLAFLSVYITQIATTMLLLIAIVLVFSQHVQILPFHHHDTNVLRGGIYGAVTWLTFASLIVSVMDNFISIDTSPIFQTICDGSSNDANDDKGVWEVGRQWLLVGFTPISFSVGSWIVNFRRRSLFHSLESCSPTFFPSTSHCSFTKMMVNFLQIAWLKASDANTGLRGEYDLIGGVQTGEDHQTPPGSPAGLRIQPRTGSSVRSVVFRSSIRTAYDNFFDPSWERRRAFSSGNQAHTLARLLLMKREERDLNFLQYVIDRSLVEFPDSQALQVFRLALLRFVFKNPADAAKEEKKLKKGNITLAPDLEYVLYAVQRRALQDCASTHMGQGQFNAINLMEFESGIQRGRQAHLLCIVEMRKFWSVAKKQDLTQQVGDMVFRLVEFDKALARAKMEYDHLLAKYPKSVQLLMAYASFCDTVLNDVKLSDEFRAKANGLDGVEEEMERGLEEETIMRKQSELENQAAGSASASSQGESYRMKVLRSFVHWSKEIFGSETAALYRMRLRLRVCFLLLFLSSFAAFFVSQMWLFTNMAQKDAHLINQSGRLRMQATTAVFFARSQVLSAISGDVGKVENFQQKLQEMAKQMKEQHLSNYENMRTAAVKTFFLERMVSFAVPSKVGWFENTLSFWEFGTEWARRIERSSILTIDSLKDPNYSLSSEEGKLNIMLMNENILRVAQPVLNDLITIYQEGMKRLWDITKQVMAVSTTVSLAIIAVISILLLHGLHKTIQKIQHIHLACVMAMQLPKVTTKRLLNYYKDAEAALTAVEEGDGDDQKWVDEEAGKVSGAQEPEAAGSVNDDPPAATNHMQSRVHRVSSNDSNTEIEIVRFEKDENADEALAQGAGGGGVEEKTVMALNAENLKMFNRLSSGLEEGQATLMRKKMENWGVGELEGKKRSGSTDEEERDSAERDGRSENVGRPENDGLSGVLACVEILSGPSTWAEKAAELSRGTWSPQVEACMVEAAVWSADSRQCVNLTRNTAQALTESLFSKWPQAGGGNRSDIHDSDEGGEDKDSAEDRVNELLGYGLEVKNTDKDKDVEMSLEMGHVLVQEQTKGKAGAAKPHNWAGLLSFLPMKAKQRMDIWEDDDGAEGDGRGISGALRAPTSPPHKEDGRTRSFASASAPPEELVTDKSGLIPSISVNKSAGRPIGEFGGEISESNINGIPFVKIEIGNGICGAEGSPVSPLPSLTRVRGGSCLRQPSPWGVPASTSSAGETVRNQTSGSVRFTSEEGMGEFKRVLLNTGADSLGKAKGVFSGKRTNSDESSGRGRTTSDEDCRGNNQGSPFRNKNKANGKDDEAEAATLMPLNKVSAETDTMIRMKLKPFMPIMVRMEIHVCALLIVVGISVLNTCFPARRMNQLVNLAPTINWAGRRRMLTRGCIHYARELVLDDGFSRMTKPEMASALSWFMEEFKMVNDAVRLGGGEVKVGADFRNPEHNNIMYMEGCPWREDPTNCSTPERPMAAESGVHYLTLTFLDALRSVLERYGPPKSEYDDTFWNPRDNNILGTEFDLVTVDPNRTALLKSDPELVFILNSFDGDIFQGLASLVEVFDIELRLIVSEAMRDSQNIFIVYMLLTFVGLYMILFRRTIEKALREGKKARSFVSRIPVHTLSQLETDTIAQIFAPQH